MAVKGKKKSRVRGSQARRRPAAAPRPSYGGRDKPRWYQTTAGLVIAFLIVVSVVIAIWAIVANNRSEAQELETAQDQLRTYTASLENVANTVTPVATDLATASELDDEQLTKDTKEWRKDLGTAQTTLTQMTPPTGLDPLNGLLSQSLLLYVQAAEQYALLPELEGDTRTQVAAKAGATFQAANNIFASAIQLLDTERQENEMASSGLTAPGAPPESMAPGGEVQIPTGEDGADQGDG